MDERFTAQPSQMILDGEIKCECGGFGRLSAGEIGQMLHDSAMNMVKSSWEAEAEAPFQTVLQMSYMLANGCKLRWVDACICALQVRGRTA